MNLKYFKKLVKELEEASYQQGRLHFLCYDREGFSDPVHEKEMLELYNKNVEYAKIRILNYAKTV